MEKQRVVVPEEELPDLVSARLPPSVLSVEYENANEIGRPGFLAGVKYLSSNYQALRKVRGDGNCFYRAFLFAYLEKLLENKEVNETERLRMLQVLRDSKDLVASQGYDEFVIETFHDPIVELFENLFHYTIDDVYTMFQDPMTSNTYMWYMRLLTASSLKLHQERFMPFVEDIEIRFNSDMGAYCSSEVEPMGKECEQIHLMALLEMLPHVEINLEYLDGREFSDILPNVLLQASNVDAETSLQRVNLLYRPGHYDILYK